MAEALKMQIISLWGIGLDDVNNKLQGLKAFLPSNSDVYLLDLLLQSDLDVERAINLHFTSASSPTPNPPMQPQPNNNHNHNNHNFAFEDSGDNKSAQIASESPLQLNLSLSPPPNGNDQSPKSPSVDFAHFDFKLREQSSSDEDIQVLNNNINRSNMHRNHRKRKYNQVISDIDVPNRNKRRKLSALHHGQPHEENDNANSNNNNLERPESKQESESLPQPQPAAEPEPEQEAETEYDANWSKKVFGRLRMEYTQNTICNVSSTTSLCHAYYQQHITIDSINGIVGEELDAIHRRIINELSDIGCVPAVKQDGITAIYGRNTLISAAQNKEKNEAIYKTEFERVRKAHFSWLNNEVLRDNPFLKGMIEDKMEKEKKMVGCGKYCIEFTISLNQSNKNANVRQYLQLLHRAGSGGKKKRNIFNIGSPFIIGVLFNNGRGDNLYNHVTASKDVLTGYDEKHSYSMVSLLDFACRYHYDVHDTDDNYRHLLNIRLHPYQLQSLRWMIDEENSDIGFMRHFYKCNRFKDNTSFYYSAIFDKLIVNKESIPRCHGGLLCEEMGLGKTVISLALINCNKSNINSNANTLIEAHSEYRNKSKVELGPPDENGSHPNAKRVNYKELYKWYKSAATLIIAPTSLVGQWEKECDDKSNNKLKYVRYYSSRSRNVQRYITKDIVFTTYGILAKENGENRKTHVLHQIEWKRIILDESHCIKNSGTQSSRGIAALRGLNRWCLTGTPFGRQLVDIENQLRFLGMDLDHLSKLSLKSISKSKLFSGCSYGGKTESIPLLNVIKLVVMRHKKAQKFNNLTIVDMPEKEEDVIHIDFTDKQREYYNKLYNTAKERYEYYKSMGSIGRGSISILASLHPARQACSGYIYNKQDIEYSLSAAQAKTFRLQEMVKNNIDLNLSSTELFDMAKEEAFDDRDGECPICYECPFEDPLQTPCKHIFCRECIIEILNNKRECPMCRTAVTPNQLKRPLSKDSENEEENKENDKSDKHEADEDGDGKIRFDSKLKVLISELRKIRETKPTEKSLIFTSFSKSLDWICSELKENGFDYRTLTGTMTMNKRKKQLSEFNDNANVKIFVLTVRSGAVGITLTAANHVFMLEPPFNAALYRQAVNRVYRLGQTKKVFIHTLIMKNSIEEKIWNINKDKNSDNQQVKNKNLAGNILSDKSANLNQSEISKLFEEDNNDNDD